jgi:hypothetical protein
VIGDNKWHHLVAEADRKTGALRLFIDGKPSAKQPLTAATLAPGASLANDAEFVAGKGIVGALDFLRVSRGTLADAETTFAELYAWEFSGPQTRDFTGKAIPVGVRRAVGALQPATGGRQPAAIR